MLVVVKRDYKLTSSFNNRSRSRTFGSIKAEVERVAEISLTVYLYPRCISPRDT